MNTLTVLQAKRFGVYHCNPDTLLVDAAKKMVGEDISCLVVVDKESYLAGIFTRSDLLRANLNEPDWQSVPVERYMSRDVVTVTPNDRLEYVASLLIHKQIHRVVIVQSENDHLRPLGVISDADLVYHMAKGL